MLTLITLVLFGILVAFFATQNTGVASVTFLSFTLKDIPMYFIVMASLLLGLLLSSLISIVNGISTSFAMHGKDVKIKQTKKTAADLSDRVHELELENERLRAEKENVVVEERTI